MRLPKTSLVSLINDAASSPEAWPEALETLTEVAGVGGAALIISNKSTRQVEEACFSGLSARFRSDYVRYYAAVDPYSPLLDGNWIRLSECLPASMLRISEWYNDFVLTCGVCDILGVRLVETPHHRVIFGIHQQIGRNFSDEVERVIDLVNVSLRHAALRHVERLAPPRWKPFGQSRTEAATGGNRYYFHIGNGSRYPDETGSVFSSFNDAMANAVALARELAEDGSWHGSYVIVADRVGREIGRVRVGL
jgi:hypothetical protein